MDGSVLLWAVCSIFCQEVKVVGVRLRLWVGVKVIEYPFITPPTPTKETKGLFDFCITNKSIVHISCNNAILMIMVTQHIDQ